MGLEENKTIEAFRQERLPQLLQSIADAAGYSLALDIDWESIAAQGIKEEALDIWQNIFFRPLIEALKTVVSDEQVSEILSSKLQKVAIRSTGKNTLSTGSYKPEYNNGLLTIDDRLCNYDQITIRAERIQKTLEVLIELNPSRTPQQRVAEEMTKVKSGSIASVLIALLDLKRRSQSDNSLAMPLLTVSLTSGDSIEGYLLDYPVNARGDLDCVLMVDQRAGKLMYVRIGGIEAVTVNLNASYSIELDKQQLVEAQGEVIKSLSADRLKINPAKIPGRLQVMRQAEALGRSLSERIGKPIAVGIPWENLPDSEAATIAVSLILTSLQSVIEQKIADPAGFKAIRQKIDKLEIQVAQLKQVVLESSTLSIFVLVKDQEIDFFSEERLNKMINNVL